MTPPNILPLMEAVAFTFGCVVLRRKWLNPERVGTILALMIAVLSFVILIVIMPGLPKTPSNFDPVEMWLASQ